MKFRVPDWKLAQQPWHLDEEKHGSLQSLLSIGHDQALLPPLSLPLGQQRMTWQTRTKLEQAQTRYRMKQHIALCHVGCQPFFYLHKTTSHCVSKVQQTHVSRASSVALASTKLAHCRHQSSRTEALKYFRKSQKCWEFAFQGLCVSCALKHMLEWFVFTVYRYDISSITLI